MRYTCLGVFYYASHRQSFYDFESFLKSSLVTEELSAVYIL